MDQQIHYSLLSELEKVKHLDRPPVDLWNPDSTKDIDMTIKSDGTWWYQGGPVTRVRLARLFSTILRLDDDGEYYLVTPVEKCHIQVDDVPFIAVQMDVSGEGHEQVVSFTTNMAEEVQLDPEHVLRLESGPKGEDIPYIHIRDGLDARLHRNVYYQMVDLAVVEEINGKDTLGLWSRGQFYKLSLI